MRRSLARGLRWSLPWLVLLGVSSSGAVAMQLGAEAYLSNVSASQPAKPIVDITSYPVGTRMIRITWRNEASGIDEHVSCRVNVNQVSTDELIVNQQDVRDVRASLCQLSES